MIRAVAALAASVALLACTAPAATASVVPGPTPTPDTTPTADATVPSPVDERAEVSARLVSLTPGALEPSSRLSASVTVTNGGNGPVEDVVLELALTERPLADRDALAEFLADPDSFPVELAAQQPERAEQTATETSAETPVRSAAELTEDVDPEPPGPSIAPGASRTLTIGATPTQLDLPEDRWGVYGAVLTLRTAGEDIAVDAVPITWLGAPVPDLQLSVLTQATGSEGRVRSILGSSNVDGVASAFESSDITNAIAFDTGLVERETWRLASGDPDLTSLAHAGETSLLDFALSVPAGTNLASVSQAKWLAVPGAVDSVSVQAASDLGASAVLATPGAAGFAELEAAADSAVARAGDTALLVPDAEFGATLAQYRPGTEAATARAIAESALVADEADGDPVLVTMGDGWHPSSSEPSPALEALLSAPWIDSLPVSELVETGGPAVELPMALDTERDLSPAQISTAASVLAQLRTLAGATTAPEAALADWGSDLMRSVATPLRDSPGMRAATAEAALDQAAAVRGSLRIAESSDLNLLAETGEIPITVVNALDYDVSVRVDLSSFSPNLQVLDTPTVTVPAGEEHAALVPVEAVSSANVRVSVVLRNLDDAPVSEAQAFAVRVRADWGNVATAVFSVLLVLLLVAGLVRTARRGRKDTRAEPAPAPDTAPDPDSENVEVDDPGGLEGSDDKPDDDPSDPPPGEKPASQHPDGTKGD